MKQVFRNVRRMLILAWQTDPRTTLGYYATTAIGAVATITVSIVLRYLVDTLIVAQNVGIAQSIPAILIIILGFRYVIGFVSGITQYGLNQIYFDYIFRYKLQNHINYEFYKKLGGLDMALLEDPDTQKLIAKARDTMTWRPPDFLRHLSYLLSSVVSILSAFIILVPFGLWIPLLVTVINLPSMYLRVKYGSIQWSIYSSGAPQVKKLDYFTWLMSTQTAIKEMRIFKSHSALLKKLQGIQQYLFSLNVAPIQKFVKILVFPSLVETVILFAIAYSQLGNVFSGILTVGSFTLLVNMLDTLNGNVGSAVITFASLYTHSLFVDDYFQVMALPKVIREVEKPIVFKKVVPPKIEFRNVSFHYPNATKLVLNHVSFTIHPGENIAFVGENGAGKSTLIKLLCRFYDVTHGEILVNGINLKKLKLSSWYDHLGILFQDFVQYHFTVRENIVLGSSGSQDEMKIREAAENAGVLADIEKLPHGLDTILGREFFEGEEVSIGQWQKVAIARAFYRQAPVLILDEPTSAIDAEAEYEIFTDLEKTYKNKTLVLVSHRFSTVRNANRIFVVHNGEIIEHGTHEKLLTLNGKYARMFQTQAKGYL